MMTTFHLETLERRLCVGDRAQRRYNQAGTKVPRANPLNSIRKPYVYGASKVALRPEPFRWINPN